MLENCKSAQERWGGVSETIDRWLQERQTLLVLFCKLTAQKDSGFTADTEETLQSFCQILVDYVSAGHFGVYEQLVNEGREFDNQTGLIEAKKYYKTVDGTTELILDFNDKYQETDDLATLVHDLSKLGECLAIRFEAEDQMVEILHNAHKEYVEQI